jgi:hypothetical protein
MAGTRLMPSGFGAVAPAPASEVVSAEGRVVFAGETAPAGESVGSAARGSRPLAMCSGQAGRW